ncbi:MAG: homocysteine S-methyltransferase family protein [Phycisphaerae bacterium]|nr:homocysteine S-methyltransferase family protein [Phycisphaerae bacterium]
MAKKSLKQKLTEGLLFLDGAMGTQLMARGIESGKCNEMLNIESPQIILDIHRSYIQAGSDAVYTNTFGANEITLARHGLADKVEQINAAAVKIAKQATGKDKYVIGDIGPSGDFLKPLGALEPDVLKNAYARQAKALCEAGVDGFIVETFMALDEAKVAAEAVKSVCSLPVFVSLAFDAVGSAPRQSSVQAGSPQAGSDFRTMMGVSVETVVSEFSALGASAIGFNCGTLKMEQYFALTEKFAKLLSDVAVPATAKHIALLAKPNGGKPELVDGKAVYKLSDKDFADWLDKIHNAGATLIGGCCGTTPAHIKAMTQKLKS